MRETIYLALKTAEQNYVYNKNLTSDNKSHILALNALYESFVHYGLAVSEIIEVMGEIEEDSALFISLIEPHLRVVNDKEMILKQYMLMYVKYIAAIAQGMQSDEAAKKLFG